jgi:ketosteroid isomerase-like protein
MGHELLDLEEAGWQALSGDGAATFYREVLTDDAVLVVPGMIVDGTDFVGSLGEATPWAGHRIDDARVVEMTPDCAGVVYHVVAQRTGEPEYRALVTSIYRRVESAWKLAFHQQTPDPPVAAPS